jgi:two-component system response regulator FlrC
MHFISQSAELHSLVARARLFAASDANVLITGESGVGKKALARCIHAWSARADAPLVHILCNSAITLKEQLVPAAGGTLLLDEPANLDEAAQLTLIEHLPGGNEQHVPSVPQAPFRCIATSRASVAALAREKGLKEELFHRLYVLQLDIPPLRERIDDVGALAEHFLSQIRRQQLVASVTLTDDAVIRLQQHDWPGNVRELRNTLFRACFIATRDAIGAAEIQASLAPAAVEAPQQYDQLKLADIERRVILRRLDRFHGNKARAAADLGVTDRTLRNKMREWREEGHVK